MLQFDQDVDLALALKTIFAMANKSKVGQNSVPPKKEYVTKKTAAEILDVHPRTVERYIESGLLTKHIRGANRVVLLRSEVLALVK